MFLNSMFKQDPNLLDFGVNYYGFLESNEYKNWLNTGQTLTMDDYDSPYFGRGNSSYFVLDKLYETYKSQIDLLDPNLIAKRVTTTTTASTISPMLILAAAAAAFFIGG